MFQRPKRASFISTNGEEGAHYDENKCFNALNGLLSFLHYCFSAQKGGMITMFQRPKRASFISTLKLLEAFNSVNKAVSTP